MFDWIREQEQEEEELLHAAAGSLLPALMEAATGSPAAAAVDGESVPSIIRCKKCGRSTMSLAQHEQFCDNEDDTERMCIPVVPWWRDASYGKHETAQPRIATTASFAWDELPATAPSTRETWVERDPEIPPKKPEHLPCPTCGRRFTPDRMIIHRRACAGQALPGFRAVVSALDRTERDEEFLRRATQANEKVRACACNH